jgi:hypothetical protein
VQKTKGGARASGRNGRVHRLWKVGEQPLSANHILCAPFAFCLGRAFKLAIAKSASGVADNQYLRVPFRNAFNGDRKVGERCCR